MPNIGKSKVLILGGSGMLGAMLVDFFSRDNALEVTATVRSQELLGQYAFRLHQVKWELVDVETDNDPKFLQVLENQDYAVNAIGVIKPYVHDENPLEVQRAINVNSLFPHLLAKAAERQSVQVIQIATDCVFSGRGANYLEEDDHDPLDVYGKTKSLGEARSSSIHHLRCSIVGPEPKGYVSLLEWFLRQPQGARVIGFTNHSWNGITTLQFAKLCYGIIKRKLRLPHVQHVVPKDAVTKAELIHEFAKAFKRTDISVVDELAKAPLDRTLATHNKDINSLLWASAGYEGAPSVSDMVRELSVYDLRPRLLETAQPDRE